MTKCKGCTHCSGDILKKEGSKEITIVFGCNQRPLEERVVGRVTVTQLTDSLSLELYPDVDCEQHSDNFAEERAAAKKARNDYSEMSEAEKATVDAKLAEIEDEVDEDVDYRGGSITEEEE